MELKNSVVLVTGAAKRVGREIAIDLARHGARLIIHYNHSRSDALDTLHEVEELGTEGDVVQADQTMPAEIRRAVAKAMKRFGRIDALVNNASIFKATPFDSIIQEDWDQHLDANLKGPFFFSQAVADGMKRRRRGKIINICDWAGIKPYTGYIPYCASKAGLLNLTIALAKTLAPHIQVNAICPGPVMWPEDLPVAQRANPPRSVAEAAIKKKTLLKRLGTPQDIAGAVRFLIESGDYITGTSLVVDGGRLIF